MTNLTEAQKIDMHLWNLLGKPKKHSEIRYWYARMMKLKDVEGVSEDEVLN